MRNPFSTCVRCKKTDLYYNMYESDLGMTDLGKRHFTHRGRTMDKKIFNLALTEYPKGDDTSRDIFGVSISLCPQCNDHYWNKTVDLIQF